MVHRVYVERRPGLTREAEKLFSALTQHVGVQGLIGVRVLNRYDVEGLSREQFLHAVDTVFSEPQTDVVLYDLNIPQQDIAFAVSALPGQFDQRADSAQQCIQMQTQGKRPLVRTARVYILSGSLLPADVAKAKEHLINPVESHEVDFSLPQTLALHSVQPQPPDIITGFCDMDEDAMQRMVAERQLAMDARDLQVCADYFKSEGRDPSETELKVIDTYWSDHCRHTTFLTEITDVACDDPVIAQSLKLYQELRREVRRDKPFTLMDVGTIAARVLKQRGGLTRLYDNGENNACTIQVTAQTARGPEQWLLFYKNETHNHPTEIEPFGGAATCIGGAIRDPLSGGGYVFAAMRVTGGGDPTMPNEDTLPGKLPQRSIAVGAAQGFASYGNQIGVATGQVKEYYHSGYVAKRLEAGAVMGAAPLDTVVRARPAPGDKVILLGGRTGRDGCGGATGSSLAHTTASVDECAAQVQKGNAPEERKLQRLFRNPEAARKIKRCNDFGAGGVSVAIGELAPGITIDLDRVPVKYDGLTATELAISESQERMAVVVEPDQVDAFIALAAEENLEATVVATITESPRLHMRWNGQTVVDIARSFLDSNGAPRQTAIAIADPQDWQYHPTHDFCEELKALAGSLNGCSQRGLIERFDATIGAGSVLMPLGGRYQATPACAMAHLLPIMGGTDSCAFMAHGFNPDISSKSPYHGAYLSVVESVANLVAAGANHRDAYLSFQEFFPKPGQDALRWGLPLAALLGALRAQMELGVAAIGGKDSMSGTFEHLDVPPTLISFAVAAGKGDEARSPEWKQAGHRALWLRPLQGADGLPQAHSLHKVFDTARTLLASGQAVSACAVGRGGAAYAAARMALGNRIGFTFDAALPLNDLFAYDYGALVLEMADGASLPAADGLHALLLGHTQDKQILTYGTQQLTLDALLHPYTNRLESVYPVHAPTTGTAPTLDIPATRPTRAHCGQVARPRVIIPVFPGTNCEWDTAQAFARAGADPQVLVLTNRTPQEVTQSLDALAQAIRSSQILMLPGGFSGGDEPDGSGKFITAVLRSAPVKDAVQELLDVRDGLLGGICNGFQALVKVGLVPYGRFVQPGEHSPTMTHNTIGRHQSRLVRVRVNATHSPWFSQYQAGQTYWVPISHGEGRFLCSDSDLQTMAQNHQIAAQYADLAGTPSMSMDDNPPGSLWAIEAITSPDGRVMGRMGHSERMLQHLYKNVPHSGDDPLFQGAVGYFK